MTSLTISCDTCSQQSTPACDDCLVSFLYDDVAKTTIISDLAEARVVRMLARSGLIPPLVSRHHPLMAS